MRPNPRGRGRGCAGGRGRADAEVRKTPSRPRSWANFSRFHLYPHRDAWANLDRLGRPNTARWLATSGAATSARTGSRGCTTSTISSARTARPSTGRSGVSSPTPLNFVDSFTWLAQPFATERPPSTPSPPPTLLPGLLTQGVPGVPSDPSAPSRGPLGRSPDGESAIVTASVPPPPPLAGTRPRTIIVSCAQLIDTSVLEK
jgi:hypothetical protein